MKQRTISIAGAVVLTLLVVAGFAFVVSLFKSNVGVYEFNNNGHWYDLGFILGAAAIFGGGANRASSGKKK